MSSVRFNSYLDEAEKLNGNAPQRAAYDSKDHCVVLAGPGSGKTKVLTTKMARMLNEDVRYPRGIACITYSVQCAKELKKRLQNIGVDESSRTFIGTVHSFCLHNVVIPYGQLAGLDVSYPIRVATKQQIDGCFSRAVQKTMGNNENPKYVKTPFDAFRRTVLDRNSSKWKEDQEYADLVVDYERRLNLENVIDFDGMVLKSLEIIQNNDWVRKVLKAKFPILVIDEYQDLGVPLHQIVLSLCMRKNGIRLFAVGDPDQSIYGFTGARPSLLNDLAKMPGVEKVQLQMNYRCGEKIIAGSIAALSENRNFQSATEHEGIVLPHSIPGDIKGQIQHVIGILPEVLSGSPNRKLGDIGILYKTQYNGKDIADALDEKNIKYVQFDQGSPCKTPLTIWLAECALWCAGGWETGEPKLSNLLRTWTRFFPSLANDTEILHLRKNLVKFLFCNRNPEQRLQEWLESFRKIGLSTKIRQEPSLCDEYEAASLLYKSSCKGQPLAQFTVDTLGGQRGSPDRINLTTMHSSKGLEYDVVFMLGLEKGQIPKKGNNPAGERRLFYVAMTRAKHEVHFLWSNQCSEYVAEVMAKIR